MLPDDFIGNDARVEAWRGHVASVQSSETNSVHARARTPGATARVEVLEQEAFMPSGFFSSG